MQSDNFITKGIRIQNLYQEIDNIKGWHYNTGYLSDKIRWSRTLIEFLKTYMKAWTSLIMALNNMTGEEQPSKIWKDYL